MKLHALLAPLVCAALLACGKPAPNPGDDKSTHSPTRPVRIGYIVKDGTAEWFRNEIRFAKEAGAKDGFEVVEISAPDGGAVMNALDTLAAKGCKATVICTPDVKLGPAIVRSAAEKGIKVVSVDDQLVDGDGKPIAAVPHVGISAYQIGRNVGRSLWTEAEKRGWKAEETGVLALTHEQLPTAQQRVVGAMDALKEGGFPAARIFTVAQPEQTVNSAYTATDPVLQMHPDCKHWLVAGMNDDAVLGAVRRMEKDLKPADIVGIGINGDKAAVDEFRKPEMSGFFGTIQLEARKHGEETARMAFRWVKDGAQPAAETLTTGTLMTRENWQAVRKEQGLE